VELDRRRVTFISLFLTLTTRPTTFAPLGITVFPSTWTGGELRGKGVTDVVLLAGESWPTVALIAVPFAR